MGDEIEQVEKQIGEILKPSFVASGAPQEARPRPMVTLVGAEPTPPVETASEAAQEALETMQVLGAQPAAPHLTITERLSMLDATNAETRQLITERCDDIERRLSERFADIERQVERAVDAIEAKLDAVLTILR